MHRALDHLNRSIPPFHRRIIRRQRHLRQTKRARVRQARGAGNLEDGHHGQGHVGRERSVAQVDVEEGGGVALEPARLNGDGSAGEGPECAVGREGHAAACAGRKG